MGGELKRIPPINQNFDKVHVNKILSLTISLTTDPGVPSHHSLGSLPHYLLCPLCQISIFTTNRIETSTRKLIFRTKLSKNFPMHKNHYWPQYSCCSKFKQKIRKINEKISRKKQMISSGSILP